jgi:hypothetical protein
VCSVVEVGERRAREEDEGVERKKKVHGQWVGDASVRKKGRTCAENKYSFAFTLFGPTQAFFALDFPRQKKKKIKKKNRR